MAQFIGMASPCCNKEFAENDDIVVCPECGSPHHRACWFEKGHCANLARHGGGYVWKSPLENAIRGYIAAEKLKDRYAKKQADAGKLPDTENIPPTATQEFDIFGVSQREIVSFQGKDNPEIIARYRNFASGGSKISINLLAGLLSPLYQFYNRDRIMGYVLFVLCLPATMLQIQIWYSKTPDLSGIMFADIFQFLPLLLTIFCCLFYDYVYLRLMAWRIIRIRERYGDENLTDEYYQELSFVGKPSFLRMISDLIIVIMVFRFLFSIYA
ncbi:MAG: hypothetical protein FWH05_06040 [Oscillospiraceae bacterium]|nr:hypothetical protein [Oscillospiraceae bacterium]